MSDNSNCISQSGEVIYSFLRLSVPTMKGTDAGSGHGCHGKAPWLLWVCSGN
jgi:hypothetical protein